MHEGEERALFAVISGKIEVTKRMEGGEKNNRLAASWHHLRRGAHHPRGIFPGSFRASEATRVLPLDARQYYVIAAAAPDIAVAVGALARERMGGLQSLAAKPPSRRSPSWATAGTATAAACGGSSTATTSSSTGSPRTPLRLASPWPRARRDRHARTAASGRPRGAGRRS